MNHWWTLKEIIDVSSSWINISASYVHVEVRKYFGSILVPSEKMFQKTVKTSQRLNFAKVYVMCGLGFPRAMQRKAILWPSTYSKSKWDARVIFAPWKLARMFEHKAFVDETTHCSTINRRCFSVFRSGLLLLNGEYHQFQIHIYIDIMWKSWKEGRSLENYIVFMPYETAKC